MLCLLINQGATIHRNFRFHNNYKFLVEDVFEQLDLNENQLNCERRFHEEQSSSTSLSSQRFKQICCQYYPELGWLQEKFQIVSSRPPTLLVEFKLKVALAILRCLATRASQVKMSTISLIESFWAIFANLIQVSIKVWRNPYRVSQWKKISILNISIIK